MQTVEEILQSIRRLAPEERERVRAELDALEHAEGNGRRALTEERRKAAMKAWLAMAGTAHSDFRDVSTDKYKHLGDVYADRP